VDTALLPGWKFLAYLQDHDQVGNRAVGDRISASVSPGLLAVGATLVLTSPFTPMLFMGEEWGAGTPWQFFTSHPEPELGKATAEGRIGEFAEHGWDADVVPDPQDPETFTRSKLDWSEPEREPHRHLLDVHRTLLALRRTEPDLVDPDLSAVAVTWDDDDRWLVVHRGSLRVVANLAAEPREIGLDREVGDVLFATGEQPSLGGSTVTLPAESAAVLSTR
jgi:maltooligosyltrehalose trehalohydrolase